MRDIKFRGLNIKTKKFVYGDLVTGESWGDCLANCSGKFIRQKEFTCEDIVTLLNDGVVSFKIKLVHIIEGTESQYTGLKDKNGKEIYEGDVGKVIFESEGIKVVGFISHENEGAQYWFDYKDLDGGERTCPINKELGLEVIGNIHENKNLFDNN